MTEAEIQAIVGFVRQWEPTAPEVATPTRAGGGGPPWLRNNASTTAPAQGKGGGVGQGQGGGAGQSQTSNWWQVVDWRIVLLAFGALSVAFTLISMGVESLRKRPRDRGAD